MEEEQLVRVIANDPQNATFVFRNEDHTLGNALRYILVRNPKTEFCGYSVPHPAEAKMNIRLQTDGTMATDVMTESIGNLIEMCQHIKSSFVSALESRMEVEG